MISAWDAVAAEEVPPRPRDTAEDMTSRKGRSSRMPISHGFERRKITFQTLDVSAQLQGLTLH